jgi:hypothetical protein
MEETGNVAEIKESQQKDSVMFFNAKHAVR